MNSFYRSLKNNVLLLFLLFQLTGCMSSLNLQVMKPADIYLGEHIKTIAIGDRTKPQSEVANVLEGILTGEGLHQDKFGKQNALVGLNDILSRSPRYKGKVTDVYIVGSGAGHVFPDPLPWEEVDKLCNFYDAEALCLMETYDSDTKITPSVKMVDKKDSEGRTYKEKEYWVEQRVRVQVGFRVYDVVKRTISDQYHFVEEMGWTGKGATEKEAMSRLINKRDATNKVSFAAGNKYGYRISPMWITVSRSYYKKDSKFPQIKRAARMVHVNDWEGAEREWKSLINCGRAKTAGRAAYNLALACEVKGLLEEARGWTMEAYTKYGNKKARDYQRILERRIYDEQRLKEQMEPVNNENNE